MTTTHLAAPTAAVDHGLPATLTATTDSDGTLTCACGTEHRAFMAPTGQAPFATPIRWEIQHGRRVYRATGPSAPITTHSLDVHDVHTFLCGDCDRANIFRTPRLANTVCTMCNQVAERNATLCAFRPGNHSSCGCCGHQGTHFVRLDGVDLPPCQVSKR